MRLLALALPDLACEIAALSRESAVGVSGALALDAPLAVVVSPAGEPIKPTAPLYAVALRARRLGVFSGQSVAAARALVGNLDVRRVTPAELAAALGRIAEMTLAFGPVASVVMPDTVLVDVTGAAHLAGGEDALLTELLERVRALGHHVRGAIAGGPRIARAVALHAQQPRSVVAPGADRAALGPLPVQSLPLGDEDRAWLIKAGVLSVDDLGRQPREAIAPRLGSAAADVLALLDGDDRAPLTPFVPPKTVDEHVAWDEPVRGTEPLLFALRGLVTRLAARLEGRAEATRAIDLEIALDASMASLAGVPPRVDVRFDFPVPLARAADLLRSIRPRIEQLALGAPARGVRVVASQVTRALRVQLDLSRDVTAPPEALPVLLAELTADLGEDRVGVLASHGSHLPEKRAPLVPIDPTTLLPRPPVRSRRKAKEQDQLPLWPTESLPPPTRLLPTAVPLDGRLVQGGLVSIDRTVFTVERIVPVERLEHVAWWTPASTSRDYARVWLASANGGAEAWAAHDRRRGQLVVHGWFA